MAPVNGPGRPVIENPVDVNLSAVPGVNNANILGVSVTGDLYVSYGAENTPEHHMEFRTSGRFVDVEDPHRLEDYRRILAAIDNARDRGLIPPREG